MDGSNGWTKRAGFQLKQQGTLRGVTWSWTCGGAEVDEWVVDVATIITIITIDT